LETELASSAVVSDGKKLQTKTADYQRVKSQIDAVQEQWEDAMLEAEEIEKKLA
jgi:ATP-binding cassette, subfamily F, member 3